MSISQNNISTTTRTTTKSGSEPGFVLLVAPSGSYRIAPYLQAARSLGFHILVVSDSEHSLVPEVADGITVDFAKLNEAFDTICSTVRSLKILCVLATDDSCVELCSLVAQFLKLPQNKPEAALLTHRKDLAREALAKAGCRTPDFQVIPLSDVDQRSSSINYPVVVKPLGLSGSRGVIRANNAGELNSACQRIDKILDSTGLKGYTREHVLVEAFLPGAEFAVEGFMIDGEFNLLTIFDKPEPLDGPYFEETYYLTPSQLNMDQKQDLIDEVKRCCAAYQLEQGPVHAEARITDSGTVLLELAARTIGGQCGQLIEFSLGQKLEELVIQGMCRIKLEIPDAAEAAGVLMIPVTTAGILKRVEGLTSALATEYIKDVEIHIGEGYELKPLPEGSSYLGFIFAQAPTYDQVYAALKSAHEKLKFVTQPVWRLSQE